MDKEQIKDRPRLRVRQFCPDKFDERERAEGRTWCVELVVGDEVVERNGGWLSRENALATAHDWGAQLRAGLLSVVACGDLLVDHVDVELWSPETCAPYDACRTGDPCWTHSDWTNADVDRAVRDVYARAEANTNALNLADAEGLKQAFLETWPALCVDNALSHLVARVQSERACVDRIARLLGADSAVHYADQAQALEAIERHLLEMQEHQNDAETDEGDQT